MLRWLRRRHLAELLAHADARALIRDHGAGAYGEARQHQQDAHNAETFAHWGRLARTVARLIGRRIGLDTATSMAMDADFSETGYPLHCPVVRESLEPGGLTMAL